MEIFKEIKEYPSYSVSTTGNIRKNSNGKILKASRKPNGYMQINLFTCDGRRKKEYIHRLIALTFIENPNKFPEVNHIDGVRDNNQVSNLEWVSHKENMEKSTLPKRISVKRVSDGAIKVFNTIGEACSVLNLTGSNVSACLNGNQRTHKGYTFELS